MHQRCGLERLTRPLLRHPLHREPL
jgi:hypothetical protein